MWLLWLCACTHEHQEMQERIEKLEAQLERHHKDIHTLKSLQVREKRKKDLCSKERKATFVTNRVQMRTFIKKQQFPRIFAHQYEGEVIGLRVSAVPEEWKTCGLEDGDVILSLQDVELRTPKVLTKLYQEHQSKDQIRFVRLRKKERQVVTIRITDAKNQQNQK